MKETFDQLVWNLVKEKRDSTIVVDNHHAYGIIKDRLDSLWEQIRLLPAEENYMMVLGGLVALAAYSQLAAENLSLISEQLGKDESRSAAEKENVKLKELLRQIVMTIEQQKHGIKSLQLGTQRFAFEFGMDTLNTWKQQIEELG